MLVWIIDDDATLRQVVREILEQDGFEVREFGGPDGVIDALDDQPALIVLDVRMPGQKGTELCRQIRTESGVPIIFLSSADDPIDRVVGLEVGADDYVCKPFHPKELAARVQAVLRRGNTAADDADDAVLEAGQLSVDVSQIRAVYAGHELSLTKTEFRLLATLMESPDKVLSRRELMAGAYEGVRVSKKTIDSHIRRLRASFDAHDIDPIRTVRGVGYGLEVDRLAAADTTA